MKLLIVFQLLKLHVSCQLNSTLECKNTNFKYYFCIELITISVLTNFKIDLVYLWVDGNDPKWFEKKRSFTGILDDKSEENNKGRYVSNDELKYSLRSVEKNIPWINKIYIVTDDQYPQWLKRDNPLVKIVDHKEIIPEEALPCFNSSVIEYFLYKIPNLEERFLLVNDDMFFNNELSQDYFFKDDGLAIVRLKKKFFRKNHYKIKKFLGKKLGQYITMVTDGAKYIENEFGIYYSGIPHHNADAYNRSTYKYAIENLFATKVKESVSSHTRKYGDLHRSTISYYALAAGKAHLKYVGRKQSSRINVSSKNYYKYMKRYNPDLFCLNDNQRAKDTDRIKIKPFLESLFPEKSSFEL